MERTTRDAIMRIITELCKEYDVDMSDCRLYERDEWNRRVDRQGYPSWMKTTGDFVLYAGGEIDEVLQGSSSRTRALDPSEGSHYHDCLEHRLQQIGYYMEKIDSVHHSIHWKDEFLA